MIVRFFPDLPPRPETPANAAFRQWFYSRWGKENYIMCCTGREAVYEPFTQMASIKTAWNGAEFYDVGQRRLAVDDDHYLILNEGQRYGSHLHSARPVGSLCIFFRPGMPKEVAAALAQAPAQALDEGPAPNQRSIVFAEHLRPHDAVVTPLLRSIRGEIEAGQDDDDWVEEQLQRLVAQIIRAEPGFRGRARRLESASRSTHAELLARVDRAADFILSSYAQRISLDDIASAAQLSKFHLVRLFRRVHGVTPYAYLLRKRLAVAQRLLATELSVNEVAEQSGFGTRFTLFRQLRAAHGGNTRAWRDCPGAGSSYWSEARCEALPTAPTERA